MFVLLQRSLWLAVSTVLLAACGISTPAPIPTVVPTELPTAIPHTPLPPTLSPDAKPGLSNLRFATREDLQDAQGDGVSFDVGVSTIFVAVDYRDLPPNTELTWRFNGGNLGDTFEKQSLAETSGTQVYDLFGDEHVALPGNYRITVRTNKQVLTAAFALSVDRLEPGAIIISDRFEDNTLGWHLSSSRLGSVEVVDGKLKLTGNWKDQHIETSAPLLLSDFDLSVDVTYEEGPDDGVALIWFRHGYILNMSADGSIIVERTAGRGITNLLEVLPEPGFQPQGVNKVRIVARGKDLEFYRNDVLIGSLFEQDAEAGPIALTAYTPREGGLIISFDNLEVRVPVKPPAIIGMR
ncbi:hypothetical protein TFLX_04348 [Thermoflexales bacterium]|nr:hypothetical protein TFLX_04348 [Thermoflexales bacterium]